MFETFGVMPISRWCLAKCFRLNFGAGMPWSGLICNPKWKIDYKVNDDTLPCKSITFFHCGMMFWERFVLDSGYLLQGMGEIPSQEIDTIRVPVPDEKTPRGVSIESYPIIYPHRVLSYLFDHVGIELDYTEIEKFWTHSRQMQEPWALESPCTSEHIPLGIHGDAAKLWTVYQVEKMVAIHFNILHFRPASIRYSRFLLFSIPRNKLLKNRTLNVVLKHLVWSFNWAYTGKHPESGPGNAPLFGNHRKLAGSPICRANRKFALVELRGDQEFHRDIWRFTSSWQSNVVCHRCPAVAKGDPAYLYYNVGPTSRWLDEEFSLTQFVSRRLKESQLSLSVDFMIYWILFPPAASYLQTNK